VISLDYHNRFPFPSSKVIERYRDPAAKVLMTSETGQVSVEISRDGIDAQIWRAKLRLAPSALTALSAPSALH
jgi:beta-lactamase superfamily II metal-dependent hydrolase